MANIMQMFRAKNKVSRNAFELSKKIAFTAKAGELLPVYGRLMMQGDVAEIGTKWKTRTMPLNRATFTRFREYYDWYFVPINLLWNRYNTWSTNMLDNNQVASHINGSIRLTDQHPFFTCSQIVDYLNNIGSATNAFGYSRASLSKKLLHYLGYGDYYQPSTSRIYNSELSPWRLLAYQKIYQDWYRNTQWETARPETCNINYMDGSLGMNQIPISDIDVSRVNMFDLQYANWNKDMFMGVLPNSQYGDAASILDDSMLQNLTVLTSSPSQYQVHLDPNSGDSLSGSNTYRTLATLNGTYYGNATDNGTMNGYPYLTLSAARVDNLKRSLGLSGMSVPISELVDNFSILALRKAEALQKFKEIQQSNSQDFPSQSEAHFGYRPSEAYSQRCRRIGGYDGTIEIQDVDNTNITENEDGTLNGADIAGKGLARGEGSMKKFTADVPGVLMCIYHVVPLLDYALNGISPDNIKTMFTDYAIPEFDKTGMQQVPVVTLINALSTSPVPIQQGEGLLGYAPAYYDYKTDIDEVKGAFYNGGLDSWVAPITQNYMEAYFSGITPQGNRFTGINANFFKINPSVLDAIFQTAADSDVSSDKFLVNAYHQVKMVRPLDVDGLPY